MISRIANCLLILIMAGGCASGSSETELAREASLFMATYAQDLARHDGAAIGDRYHRSGTHFRGSYQVFDSTRVFYEQRWTGPSSFEFGNLDYDVLGPESILVTGQGYWGRGDSLDALVINYAGLLKREDGDLRILVEDETVVQP